MSIRLPQWLLEERIFYIRFEGKLSVKDIRNYDRRMLRIYSSSHLGVIHSILDLRFITCYDALKDTRHLQALHHPRAGWVLGIGATSDSLLKRIMDTSSSIIKIRCPALTSIESALAFLQKQDVTLPDLRPFQESDVAMSARRCIF